MNHESCASYLHLNTEKKEKKSKFTIFFGAEYQVVFDRIAECKQIRPIFLLPQIS